MRRIKKLYQYLSNFLRIRLNRVQYIMFVASVVGLLSGLVSVLLKTLVHYLQRWLENFPAAIFSYLLFPAIGLLITVFIINRFFGGTIERGIAMVLKSIARRSSIIPLNHTYLHIITSSVTVGLGGSVGLEAPIVATGSAVGSNIALLHGLDYRERTLLIACGAAAGIAAVFNAPIAGVIFAIEVLLTETVVSYFIPLMVASVTGALCSKVILKESILFTFKLKESFDYYNVPFYMFLGLAAGFTCVYYAKSFKNVEHRLHGWNINPYLRALVGGLLLLSLYYLFPPLFGEGYNNIKFLANGSSANLHNNTQLFSYFPEDWAVIIFTGLIVLLKPWAAGITIGSGGNGGNFAPALFTGSYLGFFISRFFNTIGWLKLPEGNFSLVGMAGMLSGIMYCPLTAIFLIAEITNGYELFIPLMIVSSTSYFIVKHFEPYSMETKQLALDGQIFTHKKEQNILSAINIKDILNDGYQSIAMDKKVADLVDMIKKSSNTIFAVTDEKGRFAGIIDFNDIKIQMLQPEAPGEMLIRSLVKRPATIIYGSENMRSVMEKFDLTQSWYLPVLTEEKKFVGFISKTKLFNKYREILSSQHDLYEEA